jgi:GTPase
VVDAQTGVLPLDEAVARLLRTGGRRGGGHDKENRRVLLVANKCDDASKEPGAAEAGRLGFGHPLCVSAITRHGKRELIDAILSRLPAADALAEAAAGAHAEAVKIAIVGKRNAGKSTLVNALAGALAGQERVIVSEVAGTTRDSIDVRFEMDGRAFIAIDTAGLRKRKSIESDIEYYSHHRSLRSIRRADVAMLLIDSTVPVSQVDRQLVGELLRHHKPTVVVINKWDLVRERHTQEEYVKYLDGVLKGMSFAPIVFVSARYDADLRDLVAMAFNLHRQAGHRIGTGELNRMLEEIFSQRLPSSKAGKRPKVFYATQLSTHPPTLGLWVNDPELFDGGYQRFLLNRLREVVAFSEVPIQLVFKPRGAAREG